MKLSFTALASEIIMATRRKKVSHVTIETEIAVVLL